MSNPGLRYENHLRHSYLSGGGATPLAITDVSCYYLSEETAWLISVLPENGGEGEYLTTLADLGLKHPQKIFLKLLAIGAIREQRKRSWRQILESVVTPRLRLISPQVQERVFLSLGGDVRSALSWFFPLLTLSAVGFVWMVLWLIHAVSPGTLSTGPNAMVVVALILAGCVLHELGHSFASMSVGLGFRPIGFSVYLIFPAFYTNVSGIEKMGIKEKLLVSSGGFIFQGVLLLVLLLTTVIFGNGSCPEAARWITLMVLLNLNPFFRTDGYWIYKDAYSELKTRSWARVVHFIYLVAFILFSVYLLYRIGGWTRFIMSEAARLLNSSSSFMEGYKVVLGVYLVLTGLIGGMRRFREGRQEWEEFVR